MDSSHILWIYEGPSIVGQSPISLPGQCGFLCELDWQIHGFIMGRFLGFERKKILFSFSPPTLLLRLHFWPPNVWIFSPYTVQFSSNNNLTQFWHYLPRVSIKCHRLKGSLPLNEHEFEQTPGDSGGQRSLCAAVYGVAKRWAQLSRRTATTIHKTNPSLQTPVTSLGCHLCFLLTDCKSEVPKTPRFPFVNL